MDYFEQFHFRPTELWLRSGRRMLAYRKYPVHGSGDDSKKLKFIVIQDPSDHERNIHWVTGVARGREPLSIDVEDFLFTVGKDWLEENLEKKLAASPELTKLNPLILGSNNVQHYVEKYRWLKSKKIKELSECLETLWNTLNSALECGLSTRKSCVGPIHFRWYQEARDLALAHSPQSHSYWNVFDLSFLERPINQLPDDEFARLVNTLTDEDLKAWRTNTGQLRSYLEHIGGILDNHQGTVS